MDPTQSLSSYTSRLAVSTVALEPRLSVERFNRGCSLRALVRLPTCWLPRSAIHDASVQTRHAPQALTKPHTIETGCQTGEELHSSDLAKPAQSSRFASSFSQLSQTHWHGPAKSSLVCEAWETGATGQCCRMNQTAPQEAQNARKASSKEHQTTDENLTFDHRQRLPSRWCDTVLRCSIRSYSDMQSSCFSQQNIL